MTGKNTPPAETGGQDSLLNIRQAAALLNVSEISLRRWTDSGRLPCIRVGGKRERRFRREDLLRCPEQIARGQAAGKRTTVDLEGIAVDYSKHLCAFYESDAGRTKMAVPFLADGLRHDDACYLVALPMVREQLLGHLRAADCGLDRALRNGRLKVLEGFDSVADSLSYFEQAFIADTRSGVKAIRVVGDMAWVFGKDMDSDDLRRFEMTYNHRLAHHFPVVSLCLYDVREFSGRDVLGALKCHEDTFDYPLARFLGP